MNEQTFCVFSREDDFSLQLKVQIEQRLSAKNFIIDEDSPSLVIVVGGDGTMLRAIHRFIAHLDTVMFCGLHTGTLGFLSEFNNDELELLLVSIQQAPLRISQNYLLELELECQKTTRLLYAFNEARIENSLRTQVIQMYIDGKIFQTFRGNGLCISTPSGSTAFNKSLGGALIHPSIMAFQIQGIAPIDNVVYPSVGSPIILSEFHELVLRSDNFDSVILGIDHFNVDYEDIISIKIRLSKKHVRFARYKDHNFFRRVHKAFVGD